MPTFDRDDTFLARWLSGELSEEERTAFEQSEDYAAFKAIAETSTDLTTPNYDKEAGWATLDKLTPEQTPAKVRRLIPWRAIAASVAIIVLAGAGWLWSGQQSLSTLAGEQLLVELPDGSTSLLNGQSTLAYNTRLWSWRRRINLTGEAFFTVEKGATFRVTTQQGTVEVLGTSFNVYARPSGYEVHCQTGRVAVGATAAPASVVLSPLESVRYVDGTTTKETYTPTTGPGWQEGINRYSSSPLSRVITDLTAQFNLEFELDGVDPDQQYSGAFVHDDIDTALEMVFAPLGISPTRNGRIVRLTVTN